MEKTPLQIGEEAKRLFLSGHNCAQAVFLAFSNNLGLPEETALKLCAGFGGGMGRLREVCGAASAMFMVLGLKYGSTDPTDRNAKAQLYARVQELAKRFKEENGSIICRMCLTPNCTATIPSIAPDTSAAPVLSGTGIMTLRFPDFFIFCGRVRLSLATAKRRRR